MVDRLKLPLSSVCFAAALLAVAAPARASNPSAIYVYPARVDMLPNESSANQVVIHGAFFFWQTGGTYSAPMCGYMYFQCPAGQEAMCRMQWSEIKSAVGGSMCEGFGPQQMTTKATLRAPGAPLGTPDTWDLGIGITPGVFVDGKCDPAKMLGCKVPAMPDMMMSPPDMTRLPDLAPPPIADMTVANVDMTAPPSPDLATPPKPTTTCSVAAGRQPVAGHAAWLLVGLLGFGAALRRRRR